MAGISLLRSQYSNLGNVAARFALAAHQVAHETDQNVVAGLSESRANGGQEEAAPQEPRPQPFDPRSPPLRRANRATHFISIRICPHPSA
jgi:hypothetical protein